MLTFKLQKEDWLTAKPRNACNCVFAKRIKAILSPEEGMEVGVDANLTTHQVEAELYEGSSWGDDPNSSRFYTVDSENAVDCLVQFDNLYDQETIDWINRSADRLSKYVKQQHIDSTVDTEEARLALYELYKDVEWELVEVSEFKSWDEEE